MSRQTVFPGSGRAALGLIATLSGCIEDAVRDADPVRCPGLDIRSEADLRAARACEEIDGDVFIRSDTLERVPKSALPHLRKVHGSFISIGGRPLREISLPALEEVGAEPDDVLEFGFDSTHLERVALPALRLVHGSLAIVAAGALTELDLRALEHVEQHLGLMNLPQLDALEIPDEVRVQGRVGIQMLCQLPAATLPDIAGGDAMSQEQREIGCCTDDAVGCTQLACICE